MCGIIGYVGGNRCLQVIIDGLERLEYRGYDSAGIAFVKNDRLEIEKEKVDMLRNKNNISVSLLMSGESGGAYPTYQIK